MPQLKRSILRPHLMLPFILAAVVFICHIRSVTGSFHFDDYHSIVENSAVHSTSNIPRFWIDSAASSFIPENRVYRPLVYTVFTICWAIAGGATWPFHCVKILFHFGVCLALLLVWEILWKTPGWFPEPAMRIELPGFKGSWELTPRRAAFFLALIFAVHPACTECVDYIVATSSLQCAMFYIWAYYFYLRSREISLRLDGTPWVGLSLLFYFLSVASKEEGITLPAMVAVTELFLQFAEKSSRSTVAKRFRIFRNRVIPFVLFGIVLGGSLYMMHSSEGDASRGSVGSSDYFITQWRAYLWYMRLWFWPVNLNADYATLTFSHSWLEPRALLAGLSNLVILGLAWRFRHKIPALSFGVVWFYVTISPASSFVVLAEAINEHRMYLAYIGWIGGATSGLIYLVSKLTQKGFRNRSWACFYAAVFLILFGVTQARHTVWANDENLWRDTVEKNPSSGRALNNLALVYMARGDFGVAIDYLGKCQADWPTYLYCPLNSGISHLAMRQAAAAERDLSRAYRLNPQSVHANFYLGRLYQDVKSDCPRAIEFYSTAIQLTGGPYPAANERMVQCREKIKGG
jgi:tetratricopeptide (TPR) repeat protein